MALHLLTMCLLQQLGASPYPAEVGERVAVEIRGVEPLAGRRIDVVLPDGSAQGLGTTDGGGALAFVPDRAGAYRFVAEVDGRRFIAPLQVLPARRPWPYVVTCVPLGLALGYSILRRRRHVPPPAGPEARQS
jgi:hypothetical protein